MKFVTDNTGYEVMSIVSAVRRDSQSWAGWSGLRIATSGPVSPALWENVHHLLENSIGGRDGAAFLRPSGEGLVLCKDIHPQSLKRLGEHVAQFLAGHGILTRSDVYDIERDWERLTESYSYHDVLQPPAGMPRPPARPRPEPAVHAAPVPVSCRVLLVEDDPVTRWLVRGALKGTCTLWTAQRVHTAVDTYMKCRPDIVFLDLNLPDGNGRDVMREILERDPGAYIVIFSGHDSLDNIVSMIEAGARGFIAKPFSREALMGHLRSVIPAA